MVAMWNNSTVREWLHPVKNRVKSKKCSRLVDLVIWVNLSVTLEGEGGVYYFIFPENIVAVLFLEMDEGEFVMFGLGIGGLLVVGRVFQCVVGCLGQWVGCSRVFGCGCLVFFF